MLVRCYNSATTNTIVEIRPLSVSPFVMAPQIQLRDSGSAVNPPPSVGNDICSHHSSLSSKYTKMRLQPDRIFVYL